MNPEVFAVVAAVVVLAGGSLGLILHRLLPEKHVTGSGKDMVGAVVGLFTLLSALVLGLLIWTAYGVYAGQNVAIQTLAAKVLQLDLALADYGPEAKDVRAQLRQGLGKTIDEIWGSNESDANFVANNFAAAIQNLRNRDASLAALHPTTDAETQALTEAKATVESIGQSRMQMSFALTSPISIPLFVIVAAWVTFLFFGYGLMSGGDAASFVVVAVGALVVASAAYLILDLSALIPAFFALRPRRSNKCCRFWARSDQSSRTPSPWPLCCRARPASFPPNCDAHLRDPRRRFTSTPTMPETTSRLRNSGNSRMKSGINRCADPVGSGVASGLEAGRPCIDFSFDRFLTWE